MIVCSYSTLRCIDLRAGVQAYTDISVPGFVSFNVSVAGLPTGEFTAALDVGIGVTLATLLDSLELPLIAPSDALIVEVRCCTELLYCTVFYL